MRAKIISLTGDKYLIPLIQDREEFEQLCDQLETASWIAFDTEFVGEDYYRPRLCLIQIATDSGIHIIDSLAIRDVSRFWKTLTHGDHVTILHAGQHEMRFCIASAGKRPKKLFDVQVAAGLLGAEYPASYSNLVTRFLSINLKKSQSRTDWRRRPLNPAQISYAIADVEHLHPLYQELHDRLAGFDRENWMNEEMDRLEEKCHRFESMDRWKNTSGIASLNARQLAIVRSIWIWRENKADEIDKPAKRVLRDDLIVEISKLGSDSGTKIKSIREMSQARFSRHIRDISTAVQEALELGDKDLPPRIRRHKDHHYGLAGQLLNVFLSTLCRQNQVAPSIIGSLQDIHSLIAYHKSRLDEPPLLTKGWRGELIGNQLKEALAGKVSMRIDDSNGEMKPTIEKV